MVETKIERRKREERDYSACCRLPAAFDLEEERDYSAAAVGGRWSVENHHCRRCHQRGRATTTKP
jgi:hypothetical protein